MQKLYLCLFFVASARIEYKLYLMRFQVARLRLYYTSPPKCFIMNDCKILNRNSDKRLFVRLALLLLAVSAFLHFWRLQFVPYGFFAMRGQLAITRIALPKDARLFRMVKFVPGVNYEVYRVPGGRKK